MSIYVPPAPKIERRLGGGKWDLEREFALSFKCPKVATQSGGYTSNTPAQHLEQKIGSIKGPMFIKRVLRNCSSYANGTSNWIRSSRSLRVPTDDTGFYAYSDSTIEHTTSNRGYYSGNNANFQQESSAVFVGSTGLYVEEIEIWGMAYCTNDQNNGSYYRIEGLFLDDFDPDTLAPWESVT